jgi:phospholipid transport system substrate-binding protein
MKKTKVLLMQNNFNIKIFCACAFLSLALTSHAKHPAEEKLIDAVDAVLNALFDDRAATLSFADMRLRLRAVIDEKIDFSFIIRRAFGRNWQQMDPQQQHEIVNLVTETLITSYVENFAGNQRPEIQYGRLVEISGNRIEIPSKIELNGREINLLYRMGRMQSGWELFDVVAEGVSIVANYRQQFDDHFRRNDANNLIKRFREMAAKGELDL